MNARAFSFIFMLAGAGVVNGQSDSAKTHTPAWAELMVGYKSPTGLVGVAVGAEFKRLIIPSLAVGFGGPEGMNFSLGDEARLSRDRHIGVRAFAYWTYALGGHDNSDPHYSFAIGSSQLIKVGGAFVVYFPNVDIVVRAGYSWFLVLPTEVVDHSYLPLYSSTLSDPYFRDGPLFAIGLRIPL